MQRRLSIKHKMILLPLATAAAVLLAVGVALSIFVDRFYGDLSQRSLDRAGTHLSTAFLLAQTKLNEGADRLARDTELIAVAGFIGTYQRTDTYNPLIFDVEKRKAADDLARRLALSGHDLIALYDTENRLIAGVRKRKRDDAEVRVILSYREGNPLLLTQSQTGWEPAPIEESALFAFVPGSSMTELSGERGFYVEAVKPVMRSADRRAGTIRLADRHDAASLALMVRSDQIHTGYLTSENDIVGDFDESFGVGIRGILALREGSVRLESGEHFLKSVPLPVDGGVLTVVLVLGKQTYHEQRNMTMLILIGVLALSALLVLPVATRLANRSVADPVERLLEKTEAIKAGSYQNLESDPSGDEIGRLSRAFDAMAKEVWQREWELQEYRDHLEQKVQAEIAKRQEQEQLLIRQSRLAAMGEAMSSIAHHWRQPLNALAANVQDLPDAERYGEMDQFYLQRVVENSMRLINEMSATIDAFKNFFRPDSNRVQFSIVKSVERTLTMLRPTFSNNHVEVITSFKEDPVAEGYPNEFAQVILHLLTNAVDAMIERQSPLRRINVTIDKTSASKARVVICDTAGGVDPAMLSKVFEPYVSTKQKSHGSGVGLYMAKMIIEWNMQGVITARNEKEGACFTIEV